MNNLKRKMSQNDLRLLMMEKKRKLLETKKKIDSPLAKYLNDGTLMCIICNSPIKTEAIWPVHINSKQHRDNITKKKPQKETPSVQPPIPTSTSISKTKKEPVPISTASASPKIKGILKNKPTETVLQAPAQMTNSFQNVPSSDTADSTCQMEVDIEPDNVPTNELPEGFFDDPIQDAKARNIDYKDPIEEEWERFKKEIMEENAVSEQIAEEDQDQSLAEREIEMIDENIYNWSRVHKLEIKIDETVQKKKTVKKEAENLAMQEGSDKDSSYGSEEEFDGWVDWRSKRSLK